jgi:hypothetical protein
MNSFDDKAKAAAKGATSDAETVRLFTRLIDAELLRVGVQAADFLKRNNVEKTAVGITKSRILRSTDRVKAEGWEWKIDGLPGLYLNSDGYWYLRAGLPVRKRGGTGPGYRYAGSIADATRSQRLNGSYITSLHSILPGAESIHATLGAGSDDSGINFYAYSDGRITFNGRDFEDWVANRVGGMVNDSKR